MADRYIPIPVKRTLRQEACFGCAACGSPILDYHHIIPWSEKEHNEVEHMVALCPTCHRSLGKMSRDKCYSLKKTPYNKVKGLVRGCLGTDAPINRFILGSNTYINTPVIFSYFGRSIISYKIEQNQFLLSMYLPESSFWPSLKIIDNEMVFNRDGMWDFEFRTNYLKMRREDGTFFEVDIRGEAALLAGSMRVGGELFEFNSKSTNIGGASISGCIFDTCGGGISYGNQDIKLHWPTYAMHSPAPVYERIARHK